MCETVWTGDLSPPPWALDAVAGGTESSTLSGDSSIRLVQGEHVSLLSTRIPAATELPAGELERVVEKVYLDLLGCASALPTRHLVRIWNMIPGILEPLGDLRHRYLAFNAGRFHAYREWYGNDFWDRAPTASGVGAPGADLQIHALASREPCAPLQNPRQRPSHRYSKAYGKCPPCFARGVLLSHPPPSRCLVAGGTASVRGEMTVHPGHLAAQAGETLLNLATLVEIAGDLDPGEATLARFRSLRVYYVEHEALGDVSSWVGERFPGLEAVEYVRTELCRDDLLIEIEGVAELDPIL